MHFLIDTVYRFADHDDKIGIIAPNMQEYKIGGKMIRGNRRNYRACRVLPILLAICFLFNIHAFGGEVPPVPQMPDHWKVKSSFLVPAGQLKAMSTKLGANLSSVRNIFFHVNGKPVLLNVIVTPDAENAEKLMTKLRTMKAEEALLQKGLTVYEFVGQNNVLSEIAEGRRHLISMRD